MVAALGLAGISTAFSLLKMLQSKSSEDRKSKEASADETGQNLPPGKTGPASFDPAALFAALDADKSGGVDKQELGNAIQSMRAKGGNDNGSMGTAFGLNPGTLGALLNVQEASQSSGKANKLFAKLDTNQDGKVTLDELGSAISSATSGGKAVDRRQDGLEALFNALDGDKDGSVSSQELSAALANAEKNGHGHGHSRHLRDWTAATALTSQTAGTSGSTAPVTSTAA